jgi:hypothetical protein
MTRAWRNISEINSFGESAGERFKKLRTGCNLGLRLCPNREHSTILSKNALSQSGASISAALLDVYGGVMELGSAEGLHSRWLSYIRKWHWRIYIRPSTSTYLTYVGEESLAHHTYWDAFYLLFCSIFTCAETVYRIVPYVCNSARRR